MNDMGHNSGDVVPGTAGINGRELRAIVERVEHVEGEISALNEEKSDIYKEARGNGYQVKIIKKLVANRRRDPSERSEEETLVELYTRAIESVQ